VSQDSTCRSQYLLDYFGEDDSPECGECDICIANRKSDGRYKEIERQIVEALSNGSVEITGFTSFISAENKLIISSIREMCDRGVLKIEGDTVTLVSKRG
jgi:ATP-dependent DNA helicase RecQ